nr:hypothetical protein MEP434_gp22 [Methylophilales phage MEP434]
MCIMGSSKQPVRVDDNKNFVDGNAYDPKSDPFDNPEASAVDVGGTKPKKTKKPDTYGAGGIEGSSTGLTIL